MYINKQHYSKAKVNKVLIESFNQNGDKLTGSLVKTTTYKLKKVRTDGMSLIRKKLYHEILPNVIHSNLDMKIVSLIAKNISKDGYVKYNNTNLNTSKLALLFETSDRKVRGLLKLLEDETLIKRIKNKIYVNPFIILPYGNSQDQNQLLQLRWNDNYINSDETLLEQVEKTEIIEDTIYE